MDARHVSRSVSDLGAHIKLFDAECSSDCRPLVGRRCKSGIAARGKHGEPDGQRHDGRHCDDGNDLTTLCVPRC